MSVPPIATIQDLIFINNCKVVEQHNMLCSTYLLVKYIFLDLNNTVIFSFSDTSIAHTASATQLNGLSLRIPFCFCYLASKILTATFKEEITPVLAKLVLCSTSWQSVSGKILKLIGSKTNVSRFHEAVLCELGSSIVLQRWIDLSP